MKTAWVLIGVPGSGKSYWVSHTYVPTEEFRWISSDIYLEKLAKMSGKLYSEIFLSNIKDATAWMNDMLDEAINKEMYIVWDQTNLTKYSRGYKIKKLKEHDYKVVAVFFDIPLSKLEEQRETRQKTTGKSIQTHVLADMQRKLEVPSLDEGFDEIITIKG